MRRIGVLIDRNRGYGRQLCRGIARFAQQRTDWSLSILSWGNVERRERLDAYDGFLARVFDETIANSLLRTGKPVVDVYNGRVWKKFSSADHDPQMIAELAVNHFLEHLFSRFAFFGFNGRHFSDIRRDTFVQALGKRGYACEVYNTPVSAFKSFENTILRNEEFLVGSERRAIVRWLKRLKHPIAVFCANDQRAYQLATVCREMGIRVPQDLAILGVDNDTLVCDFSEPPLSSIDPNADGIGFAAAQTLSDMMDGAKPRSVEIPPVTLIERASTQVYPIDPPWLSDALTFIRGKVAVGIFAANVYRHVGKSHTLVDNAFRTVLNTTVTKYIAATRIAEAKRLLRMTKLQLTDVASQSGYASSQYFTNSFTAAVGMSPTAYRRSEVRELRSEVKGQRSESESRSTVDDLAF